MRGVKISLRVQEAQDVVSLVLEAIDGLGLPRFEPGAHIDVEIQPGLVRQYSLCPPLHSPQTYRIAIHRDERGRGGSQRAHDVLKLGARLAIGHPRNCFALKTAAHPTVLFAGGIGITPLLAMAYELRRLEAPFHLHYSARSVAHAALAGELKSVLSGHVDFHFSEGAGAARLDIAAALADIPPHAHIYVCGPRRYADAVVAGARARGWAESAIHRESFSAARETSDGDVEFVVVAKASGATLAVRKGQTILEVLQGAGINVPASCEQGICGTCLTPVLQGEPDHRDAYLTDAEHAANTQIAVCSSRARSARLVLDI
jgi:vanillate monooxygenase ferredoxin subunit